MAATRLSMSMPRCGNTITCITQVIADLISIYSSLFTIGKACKIFI